MIELLFLLAVSALIIALAFQVYFLLLQARYPEPAYADEVHIVTTEDGWKLRLHRRKPRSGKGEPVFFMHSLAANHLNFEVPHGHSLVDYLVKTGYDCWTFDSRACRDAIPPRRSMRNTATVDDILTKDIPVALEKIRSVTGYDSAHWIGHSMGGMLLYAYDAAFDGEGIACGVTLGAPPGFKGYRHVSHDALVRLNRRAHSLLALVFRGLAPYYDIWRPTSRYVPINWDNVHPRLRAREMFHTVEMPLPGIGAQMDGWAAGKPWKVDGGTVDVEAHLKHLRIPLFAIFGGIDPFISQARAKEFFESIEYSDKRMVFLSRALGDSANYNHIELVFSVESESEIFQPICKWLNAHPIPAPGRPNDAERASRKARTTKVVTGKPRAVSGKRAASTPVARKKKPSRKKDSS
ncbi:MAG: alpha/beta hydrolase [Candidatus Hydrogenedentes bacterium]|nr:alpha/beta hydrolase [Candidatus Hydrogenedentota bacterium]